MEVRDAEEALNNIYSLQLYPSQQTINENPNIQQTSEIYLQKKHSLRQTLQEPRDMLAKYSDFIVADPSSDFRDYFSDEMSV